MKNMIRISGAILLIFMINSCKKNDDNSIKDADGNVYTSVTIGTQVWMKENLKTTKYRNGDLIGTTSPATLDISLESTYKYQWAYNGDESNVNTYGRLYNCYAVTDTRNVCPVGWHVPTDAEWTTLTTYLGGENVAGGKLKEAGFTHRQSPNEGASNSSGFTAFPSGFRDGNGTYGYIGYIANWWSSSELWRQPMFTIDFFELVYYDYSFVPRYIEENKQIGFSVRCLRDN